MQHTHRSSRLHIVGVLTIALIATHFPVEAWGADLPKAAFFLRPHCEAQTNCPAFAVEDPQTLKTPDLSANATLDMDVVLTNPADQKITRARLWLAYNPGNLEGVSIDLGTTLPVATPGEKDFSVVDGFIKIDANATQNQEPSAKEIVVARIKMRVKNIPATGKDVMAFYDIQTGGHTFALAKRDSGNPENILDQKLGALLVNFSVQQSAASSAVSMTSSSSPSGGSKTSSANSSIATTISSSAASMVSQTSSHSSSSKSSNSASSIPTTICGNGTVETGEECDDGNVLGADGCSPACKRETTVSFGTSMQSAIALQPDGSICTKNSECRSGLCSSGICRGDILKVQAGGICQLATHCISGVCTNGICSVTSSSSQPVRVAFLSLQVQNLRVTTQGGSAILAWDPLPSTQLKGYTIYYGTTTGRYIQRRTIAATATDYAIHALPAKVTYYFAVRALSSTNEESAFSQEVAVEIGNPKSSTAPLTGRIVSDKQPSTVPGETGLSSDIVLLLLLSAIAGTILASRRQIIALTHSPQS